MVEWKRHSHEKKEQEGSPTPNPRSRVTSVMAKEQTSNLDTYLDSDADKDNKDPRYQITFSPPAEQLNSCNQGTIDNTHLTHRAIFLWYFPIRTKQYNFLKPTSRIYLPFLVEHPLWRQRENKKRIMHLTTLSKSLSHKQLNQTAAQKNFFIQRIPSL